MAGVTRATMTGLIDTLERDGLVMREPDPVDRRMMFVQLTRGRAGAARGRDAETFSADGRADAAPERARAQDPREAPGEDRPGLAGGRRRRPGLSPGGSICAPVRFSHPPANYRLPPPTPSAAMLKKILLTVFGLLFILGLVIGSYVFMIVHLIAATKDQADSARTGHHRAGEGRLLGPDAGFRPGPSRAVQGVTVSAATRRDRDRDQLPVGLHGQGGRSARADGRGP